MSTLGVKDDVFMKMIKRELEDLNQITFSYNLTQRNKQLFQSIPFFQDQIKQLNLNNIKANYQNQAGDEQDKQQSQYKDPLFSSILSSFAFQRLVLLKDKAKIIDRHAAVLIGVVDDYGVLKEGEVFCQVCRSNFVKNSNPVRNIAAMRDIVEVYDGDVLVTKNPCIHTGDIRRLKAVNHPSLSHLVNVIVFPQKSESNSQPEFKKMAGGDLDGDVYYITQNPSLLSQLKQVDQPAQFYSKGKAIPVEEVNVSHLIQSFTQFIQLDNLGIIANRYLAIADMSQIKARDPRCLKLGEMHAQAVDYAKHGVCVSRSELNNDKLKIKEWPHFFQKKYEPMYQSTSILGKLYDYIKLHGDFIEDQAAKRQIEFNIFEHYYFDTQFLQQGFQQFIGAASKQYEAYSGIVKDMMNTYGLNTQSQIFSLDLSQIDKRKYKNSKDRYDTENQIRLRVMELKRQMQSWFEDQVAKIRSDLNISDSDDESDDSNDDNDDDHEDVNKDEQEDSFKWLGQRNNNILKGECSDKKASNKKLMTETRMKLASAVYFVTYYSGGMQGKQKLLQFFERSKMLQSSEQLKNFMENVDKRYNEEKALLKQELDSEIQNSDQKRKEEIKSNKLKTIQQILNKNRVQGRGKSIAQLNKILSFPWICCSNYLLQIKKNSK